jgi:ribosomal protein S18 acetylase RimI-like enzyme
MSLIIEPLRIEDVKEAAEIHRQAFPDSRSTQFGKLYVQKMFTWFLTYQPNLSFVAKQDGIIVGYVIGAIGGYGRKLFRYALLEVVVGLLMHPRLWFKRSTFLLWYSYLQGLLPKWVRNKVVTPSDANIPISAALAGIGVEPDCQGSGIGRMLMNRFEQAAVQQGAQFLTLSVFADNHPARKLYEKSGWIKDNEDLVSGSIHYSKNISNGKPAR